MKNRTYSMSYDRGAMSCTPFVTQKEMSYILKYTGKNIKKTRALIPLFYTLSFISMIVVFFGSALFFAWLALDVFKNQAMIILAMVSVAMPALFIPYQNLLKKRKKVLDDLGGIITEVNASPIVFFDDSCFSGKLDGQAQQITASLIEHGQITDSEIIHTLIAKKELKLTVTAAKQYAEEHKSGASNAKKIVIKLPDVDTDNSCDNCGHPFDGDEYFCGNCGTIRKDKRRRV